MAYPRHPALSLILAGFFCSASPSHAAAPAEALTATRGRMLLNGEWQFEPLHPKPASPAPVPITVPSSWSAGQHHVLHGGVLAPELEKAVYRRTVVVPADWAGRRISLDLRRVSTEAEIIVNGRPCGRVDWPYGEVDITPAVKPGAEARLEITVTAQTPEGETWALMGYANEARRKRTLASRGLIGDVLLESSPSGTRVTDVFVQPSVRNKKLVVDVEISQPRAGKWDFTASVLGPDGKEAKAFSSSAEVSAGPLGRARLEFDWSDPVLWEPGRPHLYTLLLSAKPPGATAPADVYAQTFGFREFWIEGRDLFLNGVKIRLRPRGGHGVPSHPAEMRAFFKASREDGFNISQIWPEDAFEPGQWNFWELFADEASKDGWMLIGAAPSFKDLAMNRLKGIPIWHSKPESQAAWVAAMEREVRRFRNQPSIVIWGSTGNVNNHFADQDPRFLGQKAALLRHPQWPDTEKVAQEAIKTIRKTDPTRPIFVHAAGRLGDIFTVNHYLNLLPLQEREEMLSEYMRKGDVPYIGIEFGTPLNTTMNRGRAGFGPSHESEPFATEYAAIYLGARAYTLEPREYRRNVRFGYTGKTWGGDWTEMQWLQSSGAPFQELQSLFIRNTWRSWRAAGVTGGMIPWNELNQIFLIRDKSQRLPAPDPQPGQRGPRPETLAAMNLHHTRPEGGWRDSLSLQSLREVNGPSLAYIGGPAPTEADPVAFTAKDHQFTAGREVRKSAVLINDQRTPAAFKLEWSTVQTDNGTVLASGKEEGNLDPASNRFVPILFPAPKAEGPGPVRFEIRLKVEMDGTTHEDVFAARSFGPPPALPKTLRTHVFDPEGLTTAMLQSWGVECTPWDGRSVDLPVVVGRGALASGKPAPGSLRTLVEKGGRLLIMAQPPDYLRDHMGFRVAPHVSRRAYPVTTDHPVVAGFDAEDLRDWSSSGSLVEAKPPHTPSLYPTHGWRWGNRGSVSSAMVEKPHRSGWRPLLEGEFDLAYSPLLELDRSGGRAVLCTLDLEDAWRTDPVADRLGRRIMEHLATAPLVPARRTVFLGNEADHAFVTTDLGVAAEKITALPPGGGVLAIIGHDAPVDAAGLAAFADAGGNAVVLAQPTGGKPGLGGGDLVLGKSFNGSRTPATHPALRGLGISDTRFRSDLDWFVFGKAEGVHLDGLVRISDGAKGSVVQTQFDPRLFKVENAPMFRLTRWRHTRAVSQILANHGAVFASDARSLDPVPGRIRLGGPWKVRITAPLPAVHWDNSHKDPGISAAAKAAVQTSASADSWESWDLPAWYPPLDSQSGESVWRRSVEIPAAWNGQVLQLGLGRIKAFDTTYIDGKEIGSTGPNTANAWNTPRLYRIPAGAVKAGRIEIAVRAFAPDRQGGIHGRPEELFIRPLAAGDKSAQFYHPDYREDFDFGDDPYRYYRW